MQPFSIMEAVVFNLIRAIPIIMLGFYPFRDKRRFSPGITAFFYEGILLIWMGLTLCNCYLFESMFFKSAIEMTGFILIAALYVASVKVHPGKMIFFCFMLINVGYMITVTTKCLEGYLFPGLVLDRYRWSASLCLCIVMPVILIPVFKFICWEKENVAEDMQPSYIWQFSWLVPTTFYLIWSHEFYGTSNPVRWSMDPSNVAFVAIVNLASFLIYYLIMRMVRDNSSYIRLREENHALALQLTQYEGLNQRISVARQARHDLRHHIVTLENMVNTCNYDALRSYLKEIGQKYQLSGTFTYCSNLTANGILAYFAEEARQNDIEFKASIGIPEDIRISKTDLSILFGNLLENALEACQRQRSGERRIQVRGQTTANTFSLAIDNTYETEPSRDRKGRFRSMKHSGAGIGTESVKSIVARYKGVIEFETRGDLFCVSVMLYL